MAKFIPGPLAAEIRGSIGGSTFSQNAAGAYIRRRSVPTISTSPYAQEAKDRFTALTATWRSLTDDQRAAWSALAAEMNSTDSLGQDVSVTGPRAFIGLNATRRLVPLPVLEDPPTLPGDGMPQPPLNITLTAEKGATPAQDLVELGWFTPSIGDGWILLVGATVSLSLARNYVQNQLRFIYAEAGPTDQPFDLTEAFKNRFGDLIVGSRIHVSFKIATATGFYANWRSGFKINATVVDAST